MSFDMQAAVAALVPTEAQETAEKPNESAEVPKVPEVTPPQELQPEQTAKPADEPPQDQRLSKSWAAISKREAALRDATKAVEEQRAALEQTQSELAELRKIRDGLKADPVAALDQHAPKDWYEQATKRFLQSPTGDAQAMDKIAALEKALEQERATRDEWFERQWQTRMAKQEELTRAQSQANDYTGRLKQLVDTDDRFELTRVTPNGMQAVLDVVNGHLQQTGVLLEIEDAATLVEEELEKQYRAISGAKKLKSASKPDEASKKPEATTQKAPSGPRTLTDNLSASGTPAHKPTAQDEIRAAAKLYRQLMREQA